MVIQKEENKFSVPEDITLDTSINSDAHHDNQHDEEDDTNEDSTLEEDLAEQVFVEEVTIRDIDNNKMNEISFDPLDQPASMPYAKVSLKGQYVRI